MAKVVLRWMREDDSKEWIVANVASPIFSKTEKQILHLTKDCFNFLPGFIKETVDNSHPNSYVLNIEFDTIDNAQNALAFIMNPPLESKLYIKKQLISKKRETAGVNYQFSTEVL